MSQNRWIGILSEDSHNTYLSDYHARSRNRVPSFDDAYISLREEVNSTRQLELPFKWFELGDGRHPVT